MDKVKFITKLENELQKTLNCLRPLIKKQWTTGGLTELELERMIELEASKKSYIKVLAMLEDC